MKDYYEYVVAVYKFKIAKNEISSRLVDLKPSTLRDASLELLKKTVNKKDERILSDFFGPAADLDGYVRIINRFELERYNPLIRYVQGRTGRTNLFNIELLALLIDAPERPYNYKIVYAELKADLERKLLAHIAERNNDTSSNSSNYETQMPTANVEDADKAGDPIIYGQGEGEMRGEMERNFVGQAVPIGYKSSLAETNFVDPLEKLPKSKMVVRYILFAGLFAGLGFGIYKWMKATDDHSSCMYWTGDHYETIPCNQKMGDALVIAYDSVRLHNFKKITRTDTMTYNSIGHVWYSRMNNVIEYFTAAGKHPIQTQYELHPITVYMIDAHFKKN